MEEDIFTRLYSENIRKMNALAENEEKKRELEMHGCTFKPEINPNTHVLAANYVSNLTMNPKRLYRSASYQPALFRTAQHNLQSTLRSQHSSQSREDLLSTLTFNQTSPLKNGQRNHLSKQQSKDVLRMDLDTLRLRQSKQTAGVILQKASRGEEEASNCN